MSNALIEVKNLKKYYSSKKHIIRAVDDVSFTIQRGTTLGLVGESGCGKTTLGRIMSGLYQPDRGQVLFDGDIIGELSYKKKKELSKKIQMVFQDPLASLNPYFTIGQSLQDCMNIHKLFPSKSDKDNKTCELLEIVGLSEYYKNSFPHELSGGQLQRASIARALALRPQFIICDEVISALDVSMQAQIINLLLALQNQFSLTLLFISHDLSMVRHISDNIAVMYMGNIVEYGETDELFESPLHPYTKLLINSISTAIPQKRIIHSLKKIYDLEEHFFIQDNCCSYCANCEYAVEMCARTKPLLKEVNPFHLVACHKS